MIEPVRAHRRATFVLLLLVLWPSGAEAQPAADCGQSEACRDLALEARAAAQYERFHDLAWRAVQTGRADDPGLMYLLARAQALSGRRRDALVMLRRIADLGVATEAATDDDLRRVRELPGWREIEARFERLRAGGAAPSLPDLGAPSTPSAAPVPPEPRAAVAGGADSPAPLPPAVATPRPAPPAASRAAAGAADDRPAAPAAPAPSPVTVDPLPATDAARFSTGAFAPAGLAYDEVSRRFLFGDTQGRRLFIVGEGSTRTADLVRGDSAGFHDVTALEIGRRGDLWVTSTAADGGTAAIHRLQLISGRTLETFETPGDAPVALTDLSVAPGGTVVALDRGAPRVLRLRPGAKAIETAMPLELRGPLSLTAANSDRAAFVAHAGGLARLDLQQRTTHHVTAPAGIALDTLERIRWHDNALVAIQRLADGARALVLLQLDRAGNRVTGARIIDATLERDARTPLLTIVGDDVYYSVIDGTAAAGASVDVLVRRIRLP